MSCATTNRERQHVAGNDRKRLHDKRSTKNMIITTTHTIEGRRISRYLGIVTGETILGVNVIKDLFGTVRDFVGGRSATYERELQNARETALKELESRAAQLGAQAIVGVDLDYEVLGSNNGMLMVSATGTAVMLD